jgi:hypothetical protein
VLNAEVTKILFESEELKAERDALAGLVGELRGALEERDAQIDHLFRHSGRQGSEDYDALEVSAAWARLRSPMPALSLPLPAAAERVKVEREYCDAALAHFADTGSSHAARYDAAWAALRAARGGR